MLRRAAIATIPRRSISTTSRTRSGAEPSGSSVYRRRGFETLHFARAGFEHAACLLRPHAALALYLASLAYLLSSVYAVSGFRHFPQLALYAAALPAAYMLLWILWRAAPMPRALSAGVRVPRPMAIAWLLLIVATCLVFAHYVHLGTVPVAVAFFDTDYFSVMFIRQRIFEDTSVLWRYAPNILLKSILPFLLFYFASRSLAGFLTTLLIGALYAVSLLNKLFVVLVVLPALIASVIQLRLARVVLLSTIAVTGLAFLALIQNPQLRPEAWIESAQHIARVLKLEDNFLRPWDWTQLKPGDASGAAVERARIEVSVDRSAPVSNAFDTIRRRVIDVPGQVINTWFDAIPSKLPFAGGCGYRWLAPFLGCERQVFSAQIDQIQNPHLKHIGVQGSMTAASFMEDYANFGRAGLVGSAIALAIVLVLIAAVFGHDWQANLALTATPILMLMETPLTTIMLTGGWIFTLLLYIVLVQPHSAQALDRRV